MTLRKLARLIIREVSAGWQNSDSNITENQVIELIRGKLAKLCKVEIWNNLGVGDRSTIPTYIYTYSDRSVTKTTNDYDLYATVTMPDFALSLPYNRGVYQVCPNANKYSPYPRRLNQGVTKHLKAGDMERMVSWWQEGGTIILTPKKDVPSKVTIKLLLPAPSALGKDDTLPMTPEMLDQTKNEIKQELLQQPIQDTINDNNQDIGVKVNG